MPGRRSSIRSEIRQRSEQVIDDTEAIIGKLDELRAYASEHRRPHLHYFAFENDLKTFVNQFKRMLR